MTPARHPNPNAKSLPRLAAMFASAAALALALPGCGGGGGGSAASAPPPPPPPPSVEISGVVSDGPLQGATACYDLNDNDACDAGEPTSAATTANGSYTINVLTSVAGQHAVIVNVPADALDQTTNAPIGVALTLKAPATGNGGAQSVFVSPLTTLVVGQMQATGATAADAAAFIQAQAGLTLSPLANFGGPTPPDLQAALFARLVVQTQKALVAALAPRLGQPDLGGTSVTQADIDKAASDAMRSALPALAEVIADPAVKGAANVQAALVAAALDLVATQPALDPAESLSVVLAAKLADLPEATTPVASAVLRGFSFTDANNWSMRFMAASALDNTPDSNGLVHFYDVHKQMTAGVISSWGFGTLESRQGDVHWNGNVWKACNLFDRSSQSPRDAQGRSLYDYCDGWEKGISTRTGIDIAGQSMASVITNRIRTQAGEDNGVAYANWGPTDLGLLGNASFPAGSQLFMQTSTATQTAFAFDPTNPVTTFGTSAAAGSVVIDATQACSRGFVGALNPFNVGTLEQLTTVNTGNACRVGPQTDGFGSSLDPNLWWGASSVSLGSVAGAATLPAGTGNFFTTTLNLRVAFTGGSGVTYYSCVVRTNGGSSRNCTVIGTGSYAIQTLGVPPQVGRVMTFTGLPLIAQRLSFSRVFVERDGIVYFGYRNALNVSRNTIRLNLPAANALLSTLGIASIVP